MAKLTVITGPMFSFKTHRLKELLERKKFEGIKTLVIKTNIGMRNGPRDIPAEIVTNKEETMEIIRKVRPDFLAVEEGQFFGDWFVDIVDKLMEENIATEFEIVIVGLDMDADKKPFGMMPIFMAKANKVIKVTGTCSKCRKSANFSYYLKKEKTDTKNLGNLVKAGDLGDFDSRCAICHNLPR